ncbi:chorismate-binding protein [Protaetiibacter sp. WY-16]|uniref:isochorismate synthase n=1 Tax=Antiquaquibacter soli TaxID=3064523 RepID=A0ABT9BIM6_9MICO|nr:chorismate-binding protein [Protaetiibacter sp. WY-16]MDO7880879.1 chorismate-binding protein [Protaetiibacter sp. WY-16]
MPVLEVRTVALDDAGELLEWTSPDAPLAFLRRGDGIVGLGEAVRVPAASWTALADAALVDDSVGMPGSGLVAFGSFPFRRDRPQELVVPAVVVGRRDGRSWVTTVGAAAAERTPLGAAPTAELSPGAVTAAAYRDAVAAATRAIAAGRASKVVLARDLGGSIPPDSDRRATLARLAAAYPDTWAFAVDGMLGASPETLVRVSRGEVTARVLAGTAAPALDDAAPLSSAKNRSEHEFAVRSVLETIAPLAADVSHTDPFILTLPNLRHLATDVRGALAPGRSVLDLVAALHPTAAVGGTPTDAALELIAELEPLDRDRYAGPVGWVDAAGDGEWAIALRCARITPDGAVTAWAGAGIVADSDPDAELAETGLKLRPVIDALS